MGKPWPGGWEGGLMVSLPHTTSVSPPRGLPEARCWLEGSILTQRTGGYRAGWGSLRGSQAASGMAHPCCVPDLVLGQLRSKFSNTDNSWGRVGHPIVSAIPKIKSLLCSCLLPPSRITRTVARPPPSYLMGSSQGTDSSYCIYLVERLAPV